MQSVLKGRTSLLLGSVAFSISVGLSLVVNRDVQKALLTGLISVPAAFAGTVAEERWQRKQQKRTLNSLQTQVATLRKREIDLNRSLQTTIAEKHTAEASLNALQTERSQLQIQVSGQQNQKAALAQELTALERLRQRLEVESHSLQTQVQGLEELKVQLNQSLSTITAERQQTEASLDGLKADLSQLLTQKQRLGQELTTLNQQRYQSQVDSSNLQTQIHSLNRHRADLSKEVQNLRAQVQALKDLAVGQDEPSQRGETSSIESEVQSDVSSEWLDLMKQLLDYERQALKAIADKDTTALRNIADENLKLPLVLVESINQHALDSIGDTILESRDDSLCPEILEEHLETALKAIKLYFKV